MAEEVIASGTSSDIDSTVDVGSAIEFEFKLENDNIGIKTVSDELLDTEARASERASSEFLQNAYRKREVRFSTFRTDLGINDIVLIKGIKYIVKSSTIVITKVSIKASVVALRYED